LIPNETHFGGGGLDNIDSYVGHYLYYAKFEWSKRNVGDRFGLLCHHIGKVYPGPFSVPLVEKKDVGSMNTVMQ
jgi:hypothetical protein